MRFIPAIRPVDLNPRSVANEARPMRGSAEGLRPSLSCEACQIPRRNFMISAGKELMEEEREKLRAERDESLVPAAHSNC